MSSATDDRHFLAPGGFMASVCPALSVAIPLLVTALRAAPAPAWRTDPAIVRGVGLIPAGLEQLPSSTLAAMAALLPVGGRGLRAALVSAVATAVASGVLYGLCRRLLVVRGPTRLAAPLALFASIITTLSTRWQVEGSTAGGGTLAAAAALGALGTLLADRSPRGWIAAGALVGLTAAESLPVGLLTTAACLAVSLARLKLPALREVLLAAGAAGAVVGIFAWPLAVRALSDRSWVALGAELAVAGSSPLRFGLEAGLVEAWMGELGFVAVVLALGGALWALLLRRARPLAIGFAVFVLADALLLREGYADPAANPLSAVRLLSIAALGTFCVLAVRTAAAALIEMRVYLAGPAAVLLVTFTATLTLVAADRSGAATQASNRPSPAEVWTDEALERLPQGSLLLVRSSAIAWRLWAARTLRGERPDLVVVPVPWLARGSLAATLLDLEPALAGVIRDVSVEGRPTERSLSTLADARPLYLEIGPDWDRRLMDHLRPEPLWLGFAPHALGRSDRSVSLATGRRAFRRVLSAARDPMHPDPATLEVLAHRSRQHAVALAALGDRKNLDRVMRDLEAIDSTHPFVVAMGERIATKSRGRLDARDLLQ